MSPSFVVIVPKSKSTLVRTEKAWLGVPWGSLKRLKIFSSLSERVWGFRCRVFSKETLKSAKSFPVGLEGSIHERIFSSGISMMAGMSQLVAAESSVTVIMYLLIRLMFSGSPSFEDFCKKA